MTLAVRYVMHLPSRACILISAIVTRIERRPVKLFTKSGQRIHLLHAVEDNARHYSGDTVHTTHLKTMAGAGKGEGADKSLHWGWRRAVGRTGPEDLEVGGGS